MIIKKNILYIYIYTFCVILLNIKYYILFY